MSIPDTFTFIQRNNSTYQNLHNNYIFSDVSFRRGNFQIDEDADIYYSYYYEKYESQNEK